MKVGGNRLWARSAGWTQGLQCAMDTGPVERGGCKACSVGSIQGPQSGVDMGPTEWGGHGAELWHRHETVVWSRYRARGPRWAQGLRLGWTQASYFQHPRHIHLLWRQTSALRAQLGELRAATERSVPAPRGPEGRSAAGHKAEEQGGPGRRDRTPPAQSL